MPASANTLKALKHLRSLSEPHAFLNKKAELGSNNEQFEQAFSSLAHSYLADKTPKLLQYELGFQLLEKNDDGTRAVGIFAFKVGNTMLYAPAFFLNGDLKGHELLYIKNQDLFVPLKDAWVNYLLGRKPLALGKGVDRNLSQLGVQGPNLYQLSRAPYKWASDNSNWKTKAIKEAAYFATTSPSVAFAGKPIDLREFIKSAGVDTFKTMLDMCNRQPTLVSTIDKYYPNLLEEAAAFYSPKQEKKASAVWDAGSTPKHHLNRIRFDDEDSEKAYDKWPTPRGAKNRQPEKRRSVLDLMENGRTKIKEAAAKRKGVSAKTLSQFGGPDIRRLDSKDKEYLLKERYLVKDDRDPEQMAHAYDASVSLKLDNPSVTNVYNVLVKPDTFKKCLVIMAPYSCNGREDFCTVVDLESKKWVNIHPHNVWVNAEIGLEDFNKWYDGLSDVGETADGLSVIITRNGHGTVPFRVNESVGTVSNQDYSGCWDVHFRKWTEWHGISDAKSQSASRNPRSCFSGFAKSERIRFTGKSGAKMMRHSDGELWVPADVKIISLKSPSKADSDEDCCNTFSSEPGPLECGSLADVQILISNNTYPLKVYSAGQEFTVKSKEQRGGPISKEAAICELILRHDLPEKVAKEIVEVAERKGYREVLIKAAVEANMIDSAPNAPSFPEVPVGYDPMVGGKYPTQETTQYQLPVQDLLANQGRREEYNPTVQPDHSALQSVMQAAQTGEKEVFDTAMLGGLLKSVRDDTIIDRYLPELMKGMNALGRLLFSFYWHQDQFADRYGQADLSTIEDGLRNAFDGIGEILLTLKAKTINSTLDEGLSNDGALDDVANV